MEPDQSAASFGDAYRVALRPQTLLIQRIIDLNKQFEAESARAIGLNSTDTAARGVVMMSGPLSPSELARRLQVSTAAVTTIVDHLEEKGHVVRADHPKDRRAVLVTPTPETIARAIATLIPVAQAVDSALDGFDEPERAVIERYLTAVAERQQGALPS